MIALSAVGALSVLFQALSITSSRQIKSHAALPSRNEQEVSTAELLHLSLLHAACLKQQDTVIPWTYGSTDTPDQLNVTPSAQHGILARNDPNLLATLRQCPDIDVFLPVGLRGHGYCEDATVYAKCTSKVLAANVGLESDSAFVVLYSRLLPAWVFTLKLYDPDQQREVTYDDLCPRVPVIYFNHYWDRIPEISPERPVYLMPNIEMYELRETHYWRADVVLCKTRLCEQRVTKWYTQQGNPRDTKVMFTGHTSSDMAAFARAKLNVTTEIRPKDFSNVRFLHIVGGSSWKGTDQVLECWLSRPDLPHLALYMHTQKFSALSSETRERIANASEQISVVTEQVDAVSLGKVIAETAFFLCPSRMEGFGHYINQARASGGVILTTNAAPMNELILSRAMGVFVETELESDSQMLLGGNYKGQYGLRRVNGGIVAKFTSAGICKAVDEIVYDTTLRQRLVMATNVRLAYHRDMKAFATAMLQLRAYAAQQGNKS